ncbi:metallophosphoesterase [Orenia metallireducens]|uniref:Metallophosphoesterase n=1 Tax=Orenia metallireducens TaxID=1413210 RepID=A0A1C0ACE3_9FIRM|nr:metallophosphoesterase [Orenia metallireducens]OCL28042.1 metallophosphoesterase [Orenia metallireducens]
MKLLFLTDTHIRGTNPSRRLDDFKETLLRKLEEVREIAIEEEVDYILHGGDLFDRPDTAPSVVGEFVKLLRTYPKPIYIVAGNHDLYGHNPQTLPRTMLGLLIASGVVNLIPDKPILLDGESGITLQLSGRNFDYTLDNKDSNAYHVKKSSSADYAIHIVHGMLLDRPFFESGFTLIEGVETEADITIAGHYHLGFGVREYKGRYFLNPGSLVRASADIKEINRTPQVAIIELKDEVNITLRKLKSAPKGKEVLDRRAIEEEKFRERKLAEFIRQIKASDEFKVFSIDAILNKIASNKGLEEGTIKEALHRLELAQEEVGQGGENN